MRKKAKKNTETRSCEKKAKKRLTPFIHGTNFFKFVILLIIL